MTPDLGQGACQAMEDAVVLARCLEERSALEAGLRLYEKLSADRTAYVVRRARLLGRIGQLENPLACRLRDGALSAIPGRVEVGLQLKQMGEIVGHEA